MGPEPNTPVLQRSIIPFPYPLPLARLLGNSIEPLMIRWSR